MNAFLDQLRQPACIIELLVSAFFLVMAYKRMTVKTADGDFSNETGLICFAVAIMVGIAAFAHGFINVLLLCGSVVLLFATLFSGSEIAVWLNRKSTIIQGVAAAAVILVDCMLVYEDAIPVPAFIVGIIVAAIIANLHRLRGMFTADDGIERIPAPPKAPAHGGLDMS